MLWCEIEAWKKQNKIEKIEKLEETILNMTADNGIANDKKL